MSEITTIKVTKEIKERLRKHGEMGMSYEQVIVKLLDKIEKIGKKKEKKEDVKS